MALGETLIEVPGTAPTARNTKNAINIPVAWSIQTASAAKLSPMTYRMCTTSIRK